MVRGRLKALLPYLPISILVLVLSIAFLYHNSEWGFDDSYITYRYAKNLALGYGMVFNAGERYLGTTAPGFALILAGLEWLILALRLPELLGAYTTLGAAQINFLLDIPFLARVLSAMSLGVIGFTAYLYFVRSFPRAWGVLAGLIAAVWLLIGRNTAFVSGHETLSCIALVLVGLYLWSSRPFVSSFLLGLATLVRPDSGLAFAVVVGATAVGWLRHRDMQQIRRDCLRFVPFFIPVLLWGAAAWLYYGSPIPGTLLAKRAEVVLGFWKLVTPQLLADFVVTSFDPRLKIPMFLLAALGLGVSIWRRDRMALVGVWGVFYLVAYSLLHVTYWNWYVTPLQVVYVMLAVHGGTALVKTIWDWKSAQIRGSAALDKGTAPPRTRLALSRLSYPVSILLALVLLGFAGLGMWQDWKAFVGPKPRNDHIYSFDGVAAYLERASPNGTSLATPEPGAIAYLLGPSYRVIDTLGLASPGVAERILNKDLEWPYFEYQPDWVLVSYTGLQPNLEKPWFTTAYAKVAEFPDPYWTSRKITLQLYQKKPGITLHR